MAAFVKRGCPSVRANYACYLASREGVPTWQEYRRIGTLLCPINVGTTVHYESAPQECTTAVHHSMAFLKMCHKNINILEIY